MMIDSEVIRQRKEMIAKGQGLRDPKTDWLNTADDFYIASRLVHENSNAKVFYFLRFHTIELYLKSVMIWRGFDEKKFRQRFDHKLLKCADWLKRDGCTFGDFLSTYIEKVNGDHIYKFGDWPISQIFQSGIKPLGKRLGEGVIKEFDHAVFELRKNTSCPHRGFSIEQITVFGSGSDPSPSHKKQLESLLVKNDYFNRENLACSE